MTKCVTEVERFRRAANKLTKKVTRTKETARRYLIDVLKTHKEDGSLTPEYGGTE